MRLKKFLTVLQIALYSALLVSCSSSNSITLADDTILVGRSSVKVTELKPTSASKETPMYTVDYQTCLDIERCPSDSIGILVENMDKSKDALYYTRYHKTEMVVHVPAEEGYTEAVVKMIEKSNADASAVVNEIIDSMKTLDFITEYDTVKFGEDLEINVQGRDFRINSEEGVVVIPSIVKVSKGSIPEGAGTTTIGETILKKVITDKFDYYEYNGNSIQAIKGVDIASLITFK